MPNGSETKQSEIVEWALPESRAMKNITDMDKGAHVYSEHLFGTHSLRCLLIQCALQAREWRLSEFLPQSVNVPFRNGVFAVCQLCNFDADVVAPRFRWDESVNIPHLQRTSLWNPLFIDRGLQKVRLSIGEHEVLGISISFCATRQLALSRSSLI